MGCSYHHKVARKVIKPSLPVIIAFFCLAISANFNLHAESQGTFHEYQVKAAFLYNFVKFVEWPKDVFEDPKAPIVIGILGKDHFGTYLDEIVENKTVKGRGFVIRRFDSVGDLEACHVLFISESEKARISTTLNKLQDWHVLTVSDVKGFPKLGGIINLITEKNRIRFEINVDAAVRAGLKLSSHLLKLGKIIRDDC
jgi:hypothetical protein